VIILCINVVIIFTLDQERYHPCDVNRDGAVNITDYEILREYILKKDELNENRKR